jgi:uncharacterized protein YggE
LKSRLTVRGEHEMDVEADRAVVFMTVRGSAILSGTMGLRTVREAAEIVAELERIGVPESDIQLTSVTADVNSRAIGKSSSAVCKLRVRCTQLAQMPAIILSIGSARQASVDRIQWEYTRIAESQAECLEQAFRKAAEKARRSASALGAQLDRIRSAVEIHAAGMDRMAALPPMAAVARYRADTEEMVPDLPMGESKRLTAQVEVVYNLAPPD